ncbi:MAG: tyrosine-type recombinase/integrase [Oceanospirillaceae bacterium]|nr:tyrosine-type recombinase/integrase [Oceanospirillaceae bacterium]
MAKFKGVSPRGNSIQISFTWNDHRYRETLRWEPTPKNLKMANSLRQSVIYDIDRGVFDHVEYLKKFPSSSKAKSLVKSQADFLTIDVALWDWLKNKRSYIERSTLRDYTSAIKHHLSPRFGLLTVNQLKAKDVKEWLAKLSISNKRKNNVITPLRQCFKELYLDEVIEQNIMDRVPNLSVSSREPQPFTQDEIDLILITLSAQCTDNYRPLIEFAFYTGLRTSELIALHWSDIDFQNARMEVKRARVRGVTKEPKTSSGRRFVDLVPEAINALESQSMHKMLNIDEVFYKLEKSAVFKDDQYIRKAIWTPALKAAGIAYRSPYQTRHTYASQLLSKGANPLYVANQMGHADWGMIRKVYGKWISNL